jgi:hypothetical protein
MSSWLGNFRADHTHRPAVLPDLCGNYPGIFSNGEGYGWGHSHAERVVRFYSNLAKHPMGIASSGDLAVPAGDTSQAS